MGKSEVIDKMRLRTLTTLVAMALTATLLAAGAPASAQDYAPVTEQLSVETKFGNMYVEVTYPTKNSKPVKGPAVLTISPYSVLGRTNVAYDWVSQGYVHVWADVVGTGNSGGCYDYGGEREKRTGYEIVEWIAKQPWSNGKVGMIGGSYNGTTAWATATQAPPHLTTIVPEAAIARWYDYAYSGGMRYFLNNENPTDEGFDTPLAFDFGLAIPPPVDVQDPAWADKVASAVTPCDEIAHTEHGYDMTPDYDAFWKERDYLKDAGNIKIPVLISHNWGDWNVKPDGAYWMYKALKKRNPAKTSLYMGTRWEGHGTPGGAYDKVVKAWFDHYLMGRNTGADKLPQVNSQMSNYLDTLGWHKGKEPKVRKVTLYAQETILTGTNDYNWKLLPDKWRQTFLAPTTAKWPLNAPNAETHANHHGRSRHEWWYFETPALKKDTRIFGEVKVQMYSKVYRTWVTMTPVLLDVDHRCHVTEANQHVPSPECSAEIAPSSPVTPRVVIPVTRGFLDSRYRNGLDKQVPIEPGKSFAADIMLKPTDYTFKRHHSIALNLMSENVELVVPKPTTPDEMDTNCLTTAASPADCQYFYVDWATNKVRVVLPIVNAPKDPHDLFDLRHQHPEEESPLPLPLHQ